MIKSEPSRHDFKRRAFVDPKKKQFVEALYKQQDYKQRLNFYIVPPTEEITLEEFESWSIDRLKGISMNLNLLLIADPAVLAELESCSLRNRSPEETLDYMRPIMDKFLPLSQNTARSSALQQERRKDHYSHFILRLAFSGTEDLRRRYSRLERELFRIRFLNNDTRDRQEFVDGLRFDWEKVSEEERRELGSHLTTANVNSRRSDDEGWFKVDWEKVPELVETRKILIRGGKAYVPVREQTSMVVSEFSRQLDQALEV